ncbi:hypothetical protein HYT23_05860 [Candidatus Pacearchaeota archaeon]|nr:hypothetical protein [Candidatus Pacearchaeota archaeon]
MTPITLDCQDVEPHPVDHEEIFFKVELDGDDYTERYCENIAGGEYNINEDGYCYVSGKEAPVIFHFTEESEHNLKYYCIDALGNKGPVDDEKFKVQGDAFTIEINKKWNLISVPVKLLDDSMDVVFESPNSLVQSVWQFDGTEWFVYTPDGNSDNDGITTMEPGWGYWILANDDTELLIGGSLISPAMTPPDINIVSGWNLVGYYGINGPGCPDGICTEYNGPAGNGKEARCMLNTLGNSIWDKGFTSLWTYWEPDNPNQWKDLDQYDNLDPGAGYWLFSQEEGIYAPSTTCSGFF